jgi:hypothetical protein
MVMALCGETAYIATAKHCVEAVSPAMFGPARSDQTLMWTVGYANGDAGGRRSLAM